MATIQLTDWGREAPYRFFDESDTGTPLVCTVPDAVAERYRLAVDELVAAEVELWRAVNADD